MRRAGLALLGLVALGALALVVTLPARLYGRTPVGALTIEVAGPGQVSAREIRDALAIAPATPLRAIDRATLCARLVSEVPRIAAAEFAGGWWQPPFLRVVERIPVAIWIDATGTVGEIAADGTLLAPRGQAPADLPLLTWEPEAAVAAQPPGPAAAPDDGAREAPRFDAPGAPDLLAVLAALQQCVPHLWEAISEAHLHPDGTYELLWNDQPTVAWGRGALSATRLHAWEAVMADLQARGERDAVIDLRYRDQILVRLPDATSAGGERS